MHRVTDVVELRCYGAQGKQQGDGQKKKATINISGPVLPMTAVTGVYQKAPTNPGNFIKKSTMPGHIWNYDTPHPFLCQNPPSLSYLKKLFIIDLRVYIFLMLPYRVFAVGYI